MKKLFIVFTLSLILLSIPGCVEHKEQQRKAQEEREKKQREEYISKMVVEHLEDRLYSGYSPEELKKVGRVLSVTVKEISEIYYEGEVVMLRYDDIITGKAEVAIHNNDMHIYYIFNFRDRLQEMEVFEKFNSSKE